MGKDENLSDDIMLKQLTDIKFLKNDINKNSIDIENGMDNNTEDNDFENESFNEDNSYLNENKFNNIYEISYNVYSNKNKKMKRNYVDITNSDCDKINEILNNH